MISISCINNKQVSSFFTFMAHAVPHEGDIIIIENRSYKVDRVIHHVVKDHMITIFLNELF